MLCDGNVLKFGDNCDVLRQGRDEKETLKEEAAVAVVMIYVMSPLRDGRKKKVEIKMEGRRLAPLKRWSGNCKQSSDN